MVGQYVPQVGAFTSLAALQAAFAAASNPVGLQAYTEDYSSPTFNDGVRHRILDTGVIYAANYGIDPTGVADSAAAINLAIIDAINQKKKLYLPTGLFLLNSPLLAFTSYQQTFQMYGQGGSATTGTSPAVPSAAGYLANTILYTNYTNAPALIVNNGRNMVLKDFAILGQNVAPVTATGLSTGPPVTQSSYITSGCKTGRYAPYCGIAFDQFSNSTAQTITGITAAAAAVVTVSTTGGSNPFTIGQNIVFAGVVGMTQINGTYGQVTAIGGSSGAYTATTNINSSGYTAYSSGGTAVGLPFSKATITGISVAASAVVTLNPGNAVNPFQIGQSVYFSGVAGMTQINGLSGTVTAVTMTYNSSCTITVNINSSSFSAWTSGGIAVASDAYLSLAANYLAAYAAQGTYGCVVENVAIECFPVGIAIQCSGANTLGADITLRNVNISYFDVAVAIGQNQSRNLNIEYGNYAYGRTFIDGLNYGAGTGCMPQLLRPNLGNLYRAFAVSQSEGSCDVVGLYCESILTLGQFGISTAAAASPLTFLGGDIQFGGSGWPFAPLILETYGPTKFKGTSFTFTSELDASNFIMPTHPLDFDHCSFSGCAAANTAPQIGLCLDAAAGGIARLRDCWVNGGPYGGSSFAISESFGRSNAASYAATVATGRFNAVYQSSHVWDGAIGEYTYLPPNNQPGYGIGVSALTLNSTTVTFTCTTAWGAALQVGDLMFWTMLPQGYSLNKWQYPTLQITAIAGGTSITATMLCDPAQYDIVANQLSSGEIWVCANHWAPIVPLSCITTTGSASITNVFPTSILRNTDWLAGAGILSSLNGGDPTRVSSGGGTASITLSRNATATSAAQTITGISQAASAVATLSTTGSVNPFSVGQQAIFLGVSGMTQINGLTGTVTAIGGSSGAWTITVNIASTGFSAYTSGGTATIGTNLYFGLLQAPVMQPAFITEAVTGAIGALVQGGIASGAAVSLTTATPANIASISLTAGDWDVTGVVDYTPGTITSITILQQGIGLASATFGPQDTYSMETNAAEIPGANQIANPTPVVRVNVTATTTVYLVASATFTASTLAAYGTIRARRCA